MHSTDTYSHRVTLILRNPASQYPKKITYRTNPYLPVSYVERGNPVASSGGPEINGARGRYSVDAKQRGHAQSHDGPKNPATESSDDGEDGNPEPPEEPETENKGNQ